MKIQRELLAFSALVTVSGACPAQKRTASNQIPAVVTADAGTSKAPEPIGQTIGSIHLRNAVLRLGRGKCQETGCAGELHLEHDGKVLGSVSLAWPLPPGSIDVQTVPATGQVAGLLCPEPPTVWSVGNEERATTIALCALRPLSDRGGAVVAMESGFEHPKRSFEMFGTIDGSLSRLWQHTDGAGPHNSQLLIRPDEKSLSWVLVDAFAENSNQPDKVTVDELVLEHTSTLARKGSAGKAPLLDVVAVGPFTKASAAAQARGDHAGCLGELIVVRGNGIRNAGTGNFFLVGIAPDSRRAKVLQSSVESCAPNLKSRVSQWQRR